MIIDNDVGNFISNEYFDFLYTTVSGNRFHEEVSFRKLLMCLHDIDFIYIVKNDENREEDGLDLRYRYCLLYDQMDNLHYLNGPCSVLEMMIALAIRMEEDFMSDTRMGNRTGQWFWNMICSLGLGSQTDYNFDRQYVEDIIHTFLNRKYDRNGKGGLFTVRNCKYDLRKVEIWYQMNWYLDNFD